MTAKLNGDYQDQEKIDVVLDKIQEVTQKLDEQTDRFSRLEELGERQIDLLETQGELLEMIAESQSIHMSQIAQNTGSIATHLSEYSTENQKLVGIIAGKKQVPLSIFLIILMALGIGTLMMLASFAKMQLFVDSNSFAIVQQNKATVEENKKQLNELTKHLLPSPSQEPNVTIK